MWNEKQRYWLGGLAMVLLGMVFIVAATGKLMAGSTSFDLFAFPSFVPAVLAEVIYASLPYIELAVGVLLVLGVAVRFAVSLSALLITGFAVTNITWIILGIEECASCFGTMGSFAPVASLIIDGIMAVLVIVIFFCYRGGFFNRTPWFFKAIPEGRECGYV